jgi:hypothetical protein
LGPLKSIDHVDGEIGLFKPSELLPQGVHNVVWAVRPSILSARKLLLRYSQQTSRCLAMCTGEPVLLVSAMTWFSISFNTKQCAKIEKRLAGHPGGAVGGEVPLGRFVRTLLRQLVQELLKSGPEPVLRTGRRPAASPRPAR